MSVILNNLVSDINKDYYPQVFLREYKYIKLSTSYDTSSESEKESE